MSSGEGPVSAANGIAASATSPKGAGRHAVAVPRIARDGPQVRNAANRRRDVRNSIENRSEATA
jgi:hypothetical protein